MLQGYLSKLSARPGEPLTAHISTDNPQCHLSTVRISHGDPNPLGPGLLTVPQPWLDENIDGVEAKTIMGSYLYLPNALALNETAFTLALWAQPTFIGADDQIVSSWYSSGRCAALLIDQNGFLTLTLDGERVAQQRERIHPWRWYFLGVSAGPGVAGSPMVFIGPLGRTGGPLIAGSRSGNCLPDPPGHLWIGCHPGPNPQVGRLDGKVSGMRCFSAQLDAVALMDVMNGFDAPYSDRLQARWDLSRCNDLDRVVDTSGHGLHGQAFNSPARAVTGPGGTRAGELFSEGSPLFDAVHLHSDDIEDASWPASATVTAPEAVPSGIYAVQLKTDKERTFLPFVVRSKVPGQIVFLAPTYTWQAYSNLGRDPNLWPGLSNYALHRDGSPVYLSTSLKPSDTFSPLSYTQVSDEDAFINQESEPGGEVLRSAHLLMADLYITHWLDNIQAHYSVITDGDLHTGGAPALGEAELLVLSAHPEYWTTPMLDAASSFLRQGRNIMYLGGNGLYWVTSVRDDKPHLVEIRRGNSASQTWSAEPGEARHSFDRAVGGPWWQQGRPPNRITGLGFAGFGWGRAIAFDRTPISYEPDYSWVFEGIEAGSIGDAGLNMGGAVAFEFDRHEPLLGAPEAVVLARAAPRSREFFRTFEDGSGSAPDPLVRCDMTLWHTPWGGNVFSVGSVTATGCLPINEGANGFARMCTNVLRHFLK